MPQSLFLMLADDRRTHSVEQAEEVLEEIMKKPWNREAAEHYLWF